MDGISHLAGAWQFLLNSPTENINPDHLLLQASLDHVGRVAPQVGWGMAAHTHSDFHELILVLHGTLETRIRRQTLTAQRGDVLFYPLGEPHTEQAIGSEPLETFFLAWRWNQPDPGNRFAGWPLLVNDRNGRIAMLLHWLREQYPTKYPVEDPLQNVLLAALLFEFAHLDQPLEQSLVAKVKAYTQHHLAEPVTLDQLAAEAGLSKYHFCREFKRLSGQSPMEFLRQARVEAARSLLLSTPWTIHAIAAQVGFSDEFQLSRIFRRMTGKAPSQLRREN